MATVHLSWEGIGQASDQIAIQTNWKHGRTIVVFKTISAGLASVIVAFVAGASQAQLFIEDFDTFTGWSGGDGTQITSKTGDTTNGWGKGALHNLRRPAAHISAIGMNGTQGVRRPEKGAELGGAVRDITGEINPNGNYMVRMQNQIDPDSGDNPRDVQLKMVMKLRLNDSSISTSNGSMWR